MRQTNRQVAGPRAIGMLEVLLDHGYVPAHHQKRARNIIAQWEYADGDAGKWDESRDMPYPPLRRAL